MLATPSPTIVYSCISLEETSIRITSYNVCYTKLLRASAIRLADESFDSSSTEKVIITITDGEDHEGDVMDAVNESVGKYIKIYTSYNFV